MKKFIALAMAACLSLSLVACSGDTGADVNKPSQNTDGNTTTSKIEELAPEDKDYLEILGVNFHLLEHDKSTQDQYSVKPLFIDYDTDGWIGIYEDESVDSNIRVFAGAPGTFSMDLEKETIQDAMALCNSAFTSYYNDWDDEREINEMIIETEEDIIVNDISMHKITGKMKFGQGYALNREVERNYVAYYFFGGSEHDKPFYVIAFTKNLVDKTVEPQNKYLPVVPENIENVQKVASDFVNQIEYANKEARDEALYAKIKEYPFEVEYTSPGYNFKAPMKVSTRNAEVLSDSHGNTDTWVIYHYSVYGTEVMLYTPTENKIYILHTALLKDEYATFEGSKQEFLNSFRELLPRYLAHSMEEYSPIVITKEENVVINGIDMYYFEGYLDNSMYGESTSRYTIAGYFMPKETEYGFIPVGIVGYEPMDSKISLTREITDYVSNNVFELTPENP